MLDRDRIALGSAAAVVLASRLPFLSAGYGLDPDAWRVARAARSIAATGAYEASRLPGYPLQELTCALFAGAGPAAFNAVTALFGVAAFVSFALIARRHGVRRWLLVALAFAFTPVVYVESTTSMDYLWALAFALGAYLAALHRRPLLAGALLGAAAGCRITSGAMLLPIALVLWQGGGWRAAARAAGATAAVSLLAYAPVAARYGPGFFRFYDELGYPPLQWVIERATQGVFGTVGSAGLALAAIAATRVRLAGVPARDAAPWLAAIAIHVAAFLRLPHEAAYLVPAVPFVLLLAAAWLPDRVLVPACAALLVAPFVSFGWSGVIRGEVLQAHAARVRELRDAEAIIARAASAPGPSLVIAGPDLPKFQVLSRGRAGAARFVYKADHAQLRRARSEGMAVYVLPGQREHNRLLTGADVASAGALLLTPAGPRRLP